MANETTVVMSVPDIIGSCTLKGFDPEPGEDNDHTGWIIVDSCSFEIKRDDTMSSPPSGGGDPPEVTGALMEVEKVSVTRSADYATAPLLQWLADRDPEDKKKGIKKERVLIDHCMPSGRYYLRFELTNVGLVSMNLSYDDPDQTQETLQFTYDKIKVFQRPVSVTGEVLVKEQTTTEYDISELRQT